MKSATAQAAGGSFPKEPSRNIKATCKQAARLIEEAIYRCTEADLRALDCLMDARRALSPVVDQRKPEPPKPQIVNTAK